MDWPGIDPGHLLWETSDWPLELWHKHEIYCQFYVILLIFRASLYAELTVSKTESYCNVTFIFMKPY